MSKIVRIALPVGIPVEGRPGWYYVGGEYEVDIGPSIVERLRFAKDKPALSPRLKQLEGKE